MNGVINRYKAITPPKTQLSVILYVQNGSEQTQLWYSGAELTANSNNDNTKQWLFGYAYLKRITYEFNIIFRALDSIASTDTYVAVDNIEFNNCDLPRKALSCNNAFLCGNGACVTNYYKCDFANDCGDNSDEQNCDKQKQCDFENSLCDWGNEVNRGWIIYTGTQNLVNGPTRDHTKG
jgi:hypothetical protein